MKKILHRDVHVLDLGKRVDKSWHPVFHISGLKKYHRNERGLHEWQEDPRLPLEHKLWDEHVGKIPTNLDSRQTHDRGKQYKCLMHGYSPYKYEWISNVNLLHTKALIKAFEAWKVAEAQAVADAKASKLLQKRTTMSKNCRS